MTYHKLSRLDSLEIIYQVTQVLFWPSDFNLKVHVVLPLRAKSMVLRLATCSSDNAVLINAALIENSEPYTSGCCLEMESKGACLADLSHH